MIDLYAWTTPNGQKALILVEELEIEHELHWINIGKDEQKTPAYLAINPNNKIPAIVDRDGPGGQPLAVFESGAIATYLADKTGRLLAPSGADRYRALEWMFFNVGGPGPMLGQLGYFTRFAKEKVPHAIERFETEAHRLMGVLDRRLGESRYLVGDTFTVADIINFTWPRAARTFLGLDLAKYANLTRWIDEIDARPAVQRALARKPAP